jgi:hypothetical protein
MDRLHSDLMMNVLSFVNVVDACQGLQFTSKRFYYLVHRYQELAAPQLAAASREEDCLAQLSRKPTLVLSFTRHELSQANPPPRMYPPNAVVLGAVASHVQANIHGSVTTEPGMIMASFSPETTNVTPFYIGSELEEQIMPEEGEDYQLFIVYVCGSAYYLAQGFIATLQARYPNATIVGGICEGGFLSLEDGITEVESGIFGIMARNMPCKSIVSRGVQTLFDIPYHVHEVQFVQSTDDEYLFVGIEEPYYRITSIRDYEGKVTSPMSLLSHHQPDFCGLRRQGGDGFELNVLNPVSLQTNSIIIMAGGSSHQDENSLENAELNLFRLEGETCKQHMDWTLQQLKKQTRDERILGAVMFSCNGRGPETDGLMTDRMSDASQFQKHFPTIPCCGFYAGGEIGPLALAGHENVFQTGNAAVQGFTAVFAVFIVPAVEPRSHDLDDSDENVIAFVNTRLGMVANHY